MGMRVHTHSTMLVVYTNSNNVYTCMYKGIWPMYRSMYMYVLLGRVVMRPGTSFKSVPAYRIVATRGQSHAQIFDVECAVPALGLAEHGEGKSRRSAEQDAARRMLVSLKANDKPDGPLRS